MRVALTYNLKRQDRDKPVDYFSEHDSPETIGAIIAALEKRGHNVEAIEATQPRLLSYFAQSRVDMVFNIAEGFYGKFREAEVPAILDYLEIPYTGSSTLSLALALNKGLTKKILRAEGIPTPNFQVFYKEDTQLNADLRFPLIVKPNREGSAKGIALSSVVANTEELRAKIKETLENYQQEALVEEFIPGKELTVGILENGQTTILPVLEIDFSGCAKSGEYFYSWRMKEYQGNADMGLLPTFHCPARLDKASEHKVKEVALKTHHALGCFDISRTDIRLSPDNTPYVLEINPLPGLSPRESNFSLMAYAAGMDYDELINSILNNALSRLPAGRQAGG
jgi:D-alanine-D-alanine ligase